MRIAVFWDVTQCMLKYTNVSEEYVASTVYPEGGNAFLQNVVTDLPNYTAPHLRRQ
jgi:hypothetical protein